MTKFITKCHLLHEGVMNQPGSEVELNPKEVDIDRLIELNAIEPVEIESLEDDTEDAPVEVEPVAKTSKKKNENPGK